MYLEGSNAEVGCRFTAKLTTSVFRSRHSPVTRSPPVEVGEERVKGECLKGKTLVDLGCGPGAVTKLILERLGGDARNVEVIGIDPSPTALSKARAAIHSQVVKFIEGSAEWVSRIVSSVDAVVFLNAIHLVPDKAQVISEIRKTLNKDGVFAFNTTFFNGAYVDGTGAFWRRWVVRAVQVLRERGIEVKHSDRAVARQFLTPEEYSDLCVQAGFARPSVDLVRIEMPPESMRDIGRFSLFIEGALPGVPLEEGSAAPPLPPPASPPARK